MGIPAALLSVHLSHGVAVTLLSEVAGHVTLFSVESEILISPRVC